MSDIKATADEKSGVSKTGGASASASASMTSTGSEAKDPPKRVVAAASWESDAFLRQMRTLFMQSLGGFTPAQGLMVLTKILGINPDEGNKALVFFAMTCLNIKANVNSLCPSIVKDQDELVVTDQSGNKSLNFKACRTIGLIMHMCSDHKLSVAALKKIGNPLSGTVDKPKEGQKAKAIAYEFQIHLESLNETLSKSKLEEWKGFGECKTRTERIMNALFPST